MSPFGPSATLNDVRVESVIGRIVLQKSKVAVTKNFSRKQEAGDDQAIRIPSVAVPKSPVSLTREDQSPHVFTRKTRLRPKNF